MKQLLKRLTAIVAMIAVLLVPVTPVFADTVDVLNKGACSGSSICSGSNTGLFSVIRTVIQVMLTIAGAVAVIMIIIGGIRYVTSAGDQSDVKAAKDTILYAVVGLVITIMAYAVVTYVAGKL